MSWPDLPEAVRSVVESHIGQVVDATDVANGRSSDVCTVVRSHKGDLAFLKGVHGVSTRMRWLRNEISAGQLAPGIAPAVLFHSDVEDWLVVGFEHLAGRTACLAPGSPDLPLVTAAVADISNIRAPGLRSLHDRWHQPVWLSELDDNLHRHAVRFPDLVHGDRLVHTDLHGDQFIIGDGLHVIDWGLPGAGAAWVDAAFLVLRLIEAGHHPNDAEQWALMLPGFSEVDPTAALDAFSAYVWGLWRHWAQLDGAEPGALHRARLALDYVKWRNR